VAWLDLADRSSITAFVDGWKGPLHVLINNAGVMAKVLPEDGSGDLNGVAAYALDPENADRLWEESLRLLA